MKTWLIASTLLFSGLSTLWSGGACPYGTGHCSSGHGGLSIALYLAVMALGYWILRTVEHEKNEKLFLKRVGQTVAWTIMVVSALGILCKAGSSICRRWCPSGEKKASACLIPLSDTGQAPPVDTTPISPQSPQ